MIGEQKASSWMFTDDPNDPCSYCIQWRCAKCGATDSCDHDYELDSEPEPYLPNGSVVPLIRRDTCPRCKQTLADYYAQDR